MSIDCKKLGPSYVQSYNSVFGWAPKASAEEVTRVCLSLQEDYEALKSLEAKRASIQARINQLEKELLELPPSSLGGDRLLAQAIDALKQAEKNKSSRPDLWMLGGMEAMMELRLLDNFLSSKQTRDLLATRKVNDRNVVLDSIRRKVNRLKDKVPEYPGYDVRY